MKVFLGGTCSGRRWRDELIPMLKCKYYNPVVEAWTEEDRVRELKERASSDYVLYVITSGLKGVYSIAEVVDDSNKRPEKTVFCILDEYMDEQMLLSLEAVKKLVASNGAWVLENLEEVADFFNQKT